MGGKTVRTREKLEYLAENRARMATFSLIADALDVNENTLKSWSRTKEYKLIYAQKMLDLLRELHGKNFNSDNPKDAQWLLERQFKEEYAPPTQKSENKTETNIFHHASQELLELCRK